MSENGSVINVLKLSNHEVIKGVYVDKKLPGKCDLKFAGKWYVKNCSYKVGTT